ncbi:MAG: hypothetical protein ACAH80_06410 [Alphaproteobacteria bacterium]
MKCLRHMFVATAASLSVGCATVGNAIAVEHPSAAVKAEALDHALVVLHPYHPGRDDAQLVTTAKGLMGKSHSGFDAALFNVDGKYSFVFYGYNNGRDLNEVIRAGFIGVPRQQLREADAFVEKAMETYNIKPADMQFIGHSLGGYIAKAVAPHAGAPEVWAFNSPGLKKRDPARIERLLGKPANDTAPLVYNFNSRQDVVGLWGHQPGKIYEVDTPRRPHAMVEMAKALGGENVPLLKEKKPGVISRMFGRIANSKPVQKILHNRFRREPPKLLN